MQHVEWVLVVYYGPEAHRATYGRQVKSTRYTKDYIQLSRKKDFLDAVANLFAIDGNKDGSVPLTYEWPKGKASGAFVFKSSDRPHLKWETSEGAPKVWKMSLSASESNSETISGNPNHIEFDGAENELKQIKDRGVGQPYLVAIKLRNQPRTLHLRVYLDRPSEEFSWADIKLAPQEVQDLAMQTSQRSALAWSVFQSGGVAPDKVIHSAIKQLLESDNFGSVIDAFPESTGRALSDYLREPGYGLFFNSVINHDAWSKPTSLPEEISGSVGKLIEMLDARFSKAELGDSAAETLEVSAEEVEAFRDQIENRNYEVGDSHATTKTRGSAQRAFAKEVKTNYEFQCAVTGIRTVHFLVASHIVPWSLDPSIRLDPSNGICLSLIVDKAFEKGYLLIEDDLSIRINSERVGEDEVLLNQLKQYDGQTLKKPTIGEPSVEFLQRRRDLVLRNTEGD
jgi:hypothetical protein